MQTIAQMLENRGRQEGLRTVLTRLLRRRFGELPAHVLAQIEAADANRLELWADRVLDADSLAEVFA